MIRHMLNYLIMTQRGCHHQCPILDSEPGCGVSLSSRIMKTPFKNHCEGRTRNKNTWAATVFELQALGSDLETPFRQGRFRSVSPYRLE